MAAQGSGNAEAAVRNRDEEFWYEDGNIILVARDVEFRVYKGFLARHSPVFKDMFSLPQPPIESCSPNDLCPVVHLSDSPHDLRHILRVYMPSGSPSAFFHSSQPSYSYHAISAAIRLGHKYQMSDLLDSALDYLKTYYPTDFDEWRKFDDYGPPGFDDPRSLHAIGVVSLARLTGENGLLLMALLVCCTITDAKNLVHGFEGEDGSREQLTPDDIALCINASITLTEISFKIMLQICRQDVSAMCKTAQKCSQAFKQVLGGLGATGGSIVYPDPSVDGIGLEDTLAVSGLCVQCRAMVKERNLRERKAAWEKLPTIFGIEVPKAANEG